MFHTWDVIINAIDWVVVSIDIHFLTVQELGSLRSKYWQIWFFIGVLPGSWIAVFCNHGRETERERNKTLWSLPYKGTKEGFTFRASSQPNHLLQTLIKRNLTKWSGVPGGQLSLSINKDHRRKSGNLYLRKEVTLL